MFHKKYFDIASTHIPKRKMDPPLANKLNV